MKKLQEIDRLVEEAYGKLCIATTPDQKEYLILILTDLAKKCAEINEQDWCHSGKISTAIQAYNSRLREGQVEGLHPAIQHINAGHELTAETIKVINELAEVAYNTSVKPALQPLPENAPDEFVNLFNANHRPYDIWNWVIKHFGTHPREWWMDLKKGDKVLYRYTLTGYTQTFIWDGVAEMRGDGEWYLWDDKSTLHNVKYCAPYTASPLEQLLSTFTPEQKALWEQVKDGRDD